MKKILLIEDEKILGEMYKAKFSQAGFEVVKSYNVSWFNDPAQSMERWLRIHLGMHLTFPKAGRLLLAPFSWLATRLRSGSLLVVQAQASPHSY